MHDFIKWAVRFNREDISNREFYPVEEYEGISDAREHAREELRSLKSDARFGGYELPKARVVRVKIVEVVVCQQLKS